MALLGGGVGGAGNPVGGSFTGPAEALEIYGDFGAAYSGKVTSGTTGSATTTLLSFTTGNYLFVGGLAAQSDESGNYTEYLELLLNGTAVISGAWDATATSSELMDQPIPIIIPAYTVVEVKFGVSTGTDIMTAQLAGRIYTTRE